MRVTLRDQRVVTESNQNAVMSSHFYSLQAFQL